MRADWIVTLAWAFLNGALLALQFLFPTHVESWETTGGVVGALVLFAAGLYIFRHRDEPELHRVPDTSWATVAAAIGAVVALVGVAFGPWLFAPGLGLLALGAAGLARELRAERRTQT